MSAPSTSTPQPTVPSVSQESAFEEDYFAELLLDDDVDAELDLVVKPKKKSREERMNEAVEISKRDYRFEHGITEPWWSMGLDQHPHHLDRDRNDTGNDFVDVVDLRMVELNISQLYYLRDFQQAFNLSLRLLCPSRFSRISAAEIPMDVVRYDPKMTLVWDNVSREVAETMMRIVLQTGTRHWGGVLADGTKRSWSQGGNGPAAQLAARCYAVEERYRDAIVAISYAIVDRGLLRPFQKSLLDILTSWSRSLASTARPEKDGLSGTVETMRIVSEHCVRISKKADLPMFPSDDEVKRVNGDLPTEADNVDDIPEIGLAPEFTLRFSNELGVVDETEFKAMDKAWKRIGGLLAARRRGAGVDDEDDGVQGGRSVRTL